MGLTTCRAYKSFLFMNIDDILKTSISYAPNSASLGGDKIVKLLDFPRTDTNASKTILNDKLTVSCGKKIPKSDLRYIYYTYDDTKYTISSKTMTLNYSNIILVLSSYFAPPDQSSFYKALDIKIVSSTEANVTVILYLLKKK